MKPFSQNKISQPEFKPKLSGPSWNVSGFTNATEPKAGLEANFMTKVVLRFLSRDKINNSLWPKAFEKVKDNIQRDLRWQHGHLFSFYGCFDFGGIFHLSQNEMSSNNSNNNNYNNSSNNNNSSSSSFPKKVILGREKGVCLEDGPFEKQTEKMLPWKKGC